jgi:hypothetical protein
VEGQAHHDQPPFQGRVPARVEGQTKPVRFFVHLKEDEFEF